MRQRRIVVANRAIVGGASGEEIGVAADVVLIGARPQAESPPADIARDERAVRSGPPLPSALAQKPLQ